MLSNLNALLITWALTLIIVIGGVTLLELTYDPEEQPADTTTPANVTDGADPEAKDAAEGDTSTPQPEVKPETTADTRAQPRERMAYSTEALSSQVDPNVIDIDNMPIIGRNGTKPLNVYAAKHPVGNLRPKITLIMTNVGMNTRLSRDAIRALPSPVTIAISPYAIDADRWTDEARMGGHETLMMLPLEPFDYPRNNPGNLALLLGSSVSRENTAKLNTIMRKTDRYIGLISYMGSSFTMNSEAMRPVLTEIGNRGLMFIDARTVPASRATQVARGLGVPSSFSNAYVDENLSEEDIERKLRALENRARTLGYAVGIIRPKPITVRTVNNWLDGAHDRGFILVPVSATADKQPAR